MQPLTPTRHLRALRGGSQPHLIQASDGHHYAIKSLNNPQGRRILANEWIATAFFRAVGLPVAEVAAIDVTADALAAMPELTTQLGSRRIPWSPGRAFGSRWVVDPEHWACYDFLPDTVLAKVDHAPFVGALVMDALLGQCDARQVVFHCQRPQPGRFASATFIDHGFIFNGPHWNLDASEHGGRYFRPLVYGGADSAPWLAKVQALRLRPIMRHAIATMPTEWLEAGEAELLLALVDKMLARRKKLPELVAAALRAEGRRLDARAA